MVLAASPVTSNRADSCLLGTELDGANRSVHSSSPEAPSGSDSFWLELSRRLPLQSASVSHVQPVL